MDLLKIFKMQEPVSMDLLKKSNENAKNHKDISPEKDKTKIKELEERICELESENKGLKDRITCSNMDENDFQKLMKDYDKLLSKMLIERSQILNEKNMLQSHIQNMETSFRDLLEKYERTKAIVLGMKSNEDRLIQQLENYEQLVAQLNEKYLTLRVYSETKLAEANTELKTKHEGNIQQVAQLKATILQNQAQINELQKHVKVDVLSNNKRSMFAPLKSNIIKQPKLN